MSAPAKVDRKPGGPGPETAFSSRVLSLPAPNYEGLLPQPVRRGPDYLREIVREVGVRVASGSLEAASEATAAVEKDIPHNEILTTLSAIRTRHLAAVEKADPKLNKTDPVTGFLADAAEQLTWHAVSRQHPGFETLSEHEQIDVLRDAGEQTHGFVRRVLYADKIEAEGLAHPPKEQAVTVFEKPEPARPVVTHLDEVRALLAVQQTRRRGTALLPAPPTPDERLRVFKMFDAPNQAGPSS